MASTTPWVINGNTAPAFYEELFETDVKATVKFESIAVWPCQDPFFQRLNLPFGHVGYADDNSVSDYLFVRRGISPAPAQIRDPTIEPVWAEFRDKMIALAKTNLPAQCTCCCITCCTAKCWMPLVMGGYKTALQALVEEYKPRFAAVGVLIEYFDKSGNFDYVIKTKFSAKWAYGASMIVFGVQLQRATASGVVPAQIHIARD